MLPRELIKNIRKLEIRSRKAVSDVLAGQYHSVFKGRGMAFSEVRPYQPGDEIRLIDWNVTARLQEPYVKVFTEERELTVMLLVDVSASTRFGSMERAKAEVAAGMAAQIAFSAIANQDNVGLILFSSEVEKMIPPKKGKKHVLRVISDILSAQPKLSGTQISAGLDALSRWAKRRTVTFLISDFLTKGYERSLRVASKRHDVVPIVLVDPLEQKLPLAGLMEIEDLESGQRQVVDSNDWHVRDAFSRAMETHTRQRQNLFRQLALDSLEIQVGEDETQALARFFERRARRYAA